MVPTVSRPGLTPEQAPYLGIAQQCLHRVKMARGSLNMCFGRFRLNNGVEIFVNICFNQEQVFIKVPPVVADVAVVVAEQVDAKITCVGFVIDNYYSATWEASWYPYIVSSYPSSTVRKCKKNLMPEYILGKRGTRYLDGVAKIFKLQATVTRLYSSVPGYGYITELQLDTSLQSMMIADGPLYKIDTTKGVTIDGLPTSIQFVTFCNSATSTHRVLLHNTTDYISENTYNIGDKVLLNYPLVNIVYQLKTGEFETLLFPYPQLSIVGLAGNPNDDDLLFVLDGTSAINQNFCNICTNSEFLYKTHLGIPEGRTSQLYFVRYSANTKTYKVMSGDRDIYTYPYDVSIDLKDDLEFTDDEISLLYENRIAEIPYSKKILLHEHGGLFSILWYYQYGYAYIYSKIELVFNDTATEIGAIWKYGIASYADRPEVWSWEVYGLYKGESQHDGITDVFGYIKNAEFSYKQGGFSDYWAVGGESESFLCVLDDTEYTSTANRIKCGDRYNCIWGDNTWSGDVEYAQMYIDFNFGFYLNKKTDHLHNIICREHYYQTTNTITDKSQTDEIPPNHSHPHGIAVFFYVDDGSQFEYGRLSDISRVPLPEIFYILRYIKCQSSEHVNADFITPESEYANIPAGFINGTITPLSRMEYKIDWCACEIAYDGMPVDGTRVVKFYCDNNLVETLSDIISFKRIHIQAKFYAPAYKQDGTIYNEMYNERLKSPTRISILPNIVIISDSMSTKCISYPNWGSKQSISLFGDTQLLALTDLGYWDWTNSDYYKTPKVYFFSSMNIDWSALDSSLTEVSNKCIIPITSTARWYLEYPIEIKNKDITTQS